MKQAAKNISTLMSRDQQSVMSVGVAILREIITMVSCVILQLLSAKLGVTVKVSYKSEISRYKGRICKTECHLGASRHMERMDWRGTSDAT